MGRHRVRGRTWAKGRAWGAQSETGGHSVWLRGPRSIVGRKKQAELRAFAEQTLFITGGGLRDSRPEPDDDISLRTPCQRSRIRLEASDRIKLRWWSTMEPIVVQWEKGEGGGDGGRRVQEVDDRIRSKQPFHRPFYAVESSSAYSLFIARYCLPLSCGTLPDTFWCFIICSSSIDASVKPSKNNRRPNCVLTCAPTLYGATEEINGKKT